LVLKFVESSRRRLLLPTTPNLVTNKFLEHQISIYMFSEGSCGT